MVQVARLKTTPILDTIPEEDNDVELIQDIQLDSPGSPLPSDWPHTDREVLRAFLQNFSREEDI